MKSPTEWRTIFQDRYARAVGQTNITGISFDMNKLIEELITDAQDDALGLPPADRPNYGIISHSEVLASQKQ